MTTVTKIIHQLQIRKYSEEEWIEGIRNMKPQVIQKFYKKQLPIIRKMIFRYEIGRETEAEDIVIDALMILINNLGSDKFEARSKLDTYFYRICTNICLDKVKYNKKIPLSLNVDIQDIQLQDYPTFYEHTESPNPLFETENRLAITLEIIKTLDTICQRLFDMRFGIVQQENGMLVSSGKRRFIEIALIMEMTEENARQKYKRCLSKLYSEYKRRTTEN